MVRVGGHFHSDHPLDTVFLNHVVASGAQAAQFFLGDPQGWKGPVIPGGDAAALEDAYAKADVDLYIHAPYVINVASTNNRIRIPSRKLLDQQLKGAASVGAKGLIVHGGHVTGEVDPAQGVANWVKAMQQIERPLPLLIENTAGGNHAMARTLDALARLWEAVAGAAEGGGEVGFCLDTCHANSAGIDLADAVDRIKAVTGRIDLVHCNNSRDEFNSGADRHANFDAGTIDKAILLDVVRAAGAPVICETPEAGLADDIAWLRDNLAASSRW
ncbi:MAG: deoxyribonuclease IV [Trebonia sp.]